MRAMGYAPKNTSQGALATMNHLKLASLLMSCIFFTPTAFAVDSLIDRKGIYLGAFGGWGELEATSLRQIGTVLLPGPLPDLPIDADGGTDSPNVAVGGVQLGYQWPAWNSASGWGVKPAVELEGLYLGEHSPEGEMPIRPRFLGTQYVSFDTKGYALLATALLTVETPWSQRFRPYAGFSAGTARLSLSNADSTNPSEPGINHFNSDPEAADNASARQFKLGLESNLSQHLSLFTEYRYLHIDKTRYTFGPTVYPGQHPPTESWDVRMGELKYKLFAAGFQYRF